MHKARAVSVMAKDVTCLVSQRKYTVRKTCSTRPGRAVSTPLYPSPVRLSASGSPPGSCSNTSSTSSLFACPSCPDGFTFRVHWESAFSYKGK